MSDFQYIILQSNKIDDILKSLDISETKFLYPNELSGGMKRRAAIIRAIAFEGEALILDEPFNGIDAENKLIMAEMIKREFLQKGKSVLMVSHIDSDAELLNASVYHFE